MTYTPFTAVLVAAFLVGVTCAQDDQGNFIEPDCDVPQGDDACWMPPMEPLEFVEWDGDDGGTGDYYAIRVYDRAIPWWQANRDAQALGGHLAQITSTGENNHIYYLALNTIGAWSDQYGPWIGAFRCPPQGGDPTAGWTWCKGELPALDYMNFPAGELDGATVLPWRVCFDASSGPSSFWAQALPTPQAGANVHSAVIELPLAAINDCNQNGVPDSNDIFAGAPDINGNMVPDACDCLSDISGGDHQVDGADLAIILLSWQDTGPFGVAGDVNWDGVVDAADLGQLLIAWGPCPH